MGIEILLGVGLSLLAELKKLIFKKWGWEISTPLFQFGLLLTCFVLAAIYKWTPQVYTEEAGVILGTAVVWYEFIWKNTKVLFKKS
jgi:hypothetical protein